MTTMPFRLFEEMAKVFPVVDFQHEARAAVDAALDDVLRNSG